MPVGRLPIWRSSKNGDHLFSVSPTEGPNAGYLDEGAAFLTITVLGDNGLNTGLTPPTGMKRLVRCVNPSVGMHTVRLNACLLTENYEGPSGYIFQSTSSASTYSVGATVIPLYTCDYPLGNGHSKNFVTPNEAECGAPFINKAILGYTFK